MNYVEVAALPVTVLGFGFTGRLSQGRECKRRP